MQRDYRITHKWTDDELATNIQRIESIKAHIYPLAHIDVAAQIGYSVNHFGKLLMGVQWLDKDLYEAIMDIDVALYLKTCKDVARRTEKKLRHIVDGYPAAKEAVDKYF